MNRRRTLLLQVAAATLLLGAVGLPALAQGASRTTTIELNIDEVYDQLAGGKIVFTIAFRDPLTRKLNPTLRVHEGDDLAIKLVNRTSRTRSFAIMSVPGTASTPIRAGATGLVRFPAPPKGHYTYHDPSQAGLPETRSLFGDLMVEPR